jgi:hypothetical protein
MAFRKKAEFILPLKPDILIVPECEHPDKQKFKKELSIPTDFLWFGSNPNKGLGIFSYSDFKFRLLDEYNPKLRIIIPLSVTNGKHSFTLFAIWANNPDDTDGQYIEQVWKAIHYYENLLSNKNSILIGDFNSNTISDRKHQDSNHSNVVKFLEQKGIYCVYHFHHKQEQGNEEHTTLFMYRHKDKPYHVDYCFASVDFLERLSNIGVGTYDDWIEKSDHSPFYNVNMTSGLCIASPSQKMPAKRTAESSLKRGSS